MSGQQTFPVARLSLTAGQEDMLVITQTTGWQEGRRKAMGVEYDFLRQAAQTLGCYKVELAVTQTIGW